MSYYRKKPVVIEAVEWTGTNLNEVIEFAGENIKHEIHDAAWKAGVAAPIIILEIKTLEGSMRANAGDYIIKGINGEVYPCKPDIFEKTYEAYDGPWGNL